MSNCIDILEWFKMKVNNLPEISFADINILINIMLKLSDNTDPMSKLKPLMTKCTTSLCYSSLKCDNLDITHKKQLLNKFGTVMSVVEDEKELHDILQESPVKHFSNHSKHLC